MAASTVRRSPWYNSLIEMHNSLGEAHTTSRWVSGQFHCPFTSFSFLEAPCPHPAGCTSSKVEILNTFHSLSLAHLLLRWCWAEKMSQALFPRKPQVLPKSSFFSLLQGQSGSADLNTSCIQTFSYLQTEWTQHQTTANNPAVMYVVSIAITDMKFLLFH